MDSERSAVNRYFPLSTLVTCSSRADGQRFVLMTMKTSESLSSGALEAEGEYLS